MIKTLAYYPIAVAIATSGCHKTTPKDAIINPQYELKCENVKNTLDIEISRCENNEVICYTKSNAIACFRKEYK